jgi:hypothetical protein
MPMQSHPWIDWMLATGAALATGAEAAAATSKRSSAGAAISSDGRRLCILEMANWGLLCVLV